MLTDNPPKTAPELSYLDYVIMIALLDAEASRPAKENEDKVPLTSFISSIEEMSKEAENYNRTRHVHEQAQFGTATEVPRDPTMFKTQAWVPFGHADLLTLTLSDDIDAAQAIIERYTRTVEDVMVGYCPDPLPYQKAWNLPDIKCPLIAPREMSQLIQSEGISKYPLMLFSKLRMSPLLSFGRALINQRLIYAAMLGALAKAVEHLSETASTLIGKADLESFKICFLDLQGEEEFGLLIYCNNYSVAVSALTLIQNLTWQHLHDTDPALFSTAIQCRVFNEALGTIASSTDETNNTLDSVQHTLQRMGGNHLFRWTTSRACVAWDYFKKAEKERADVPIRGSLSYKVSVGTLPGHQREVEEKILPKTRFNSEYRLHTLGAEDLLLLPPDQKLTPTSDFIKMCLGVYDNMLAAQRTARHLTLWAANRVNSRPNRECY